MEGARLERLPGSCEKLGGSFSGCSRSRRGRETDQTKAIPSANCGDRTPAPLLPALNSMLRTTTETGDIGQFSIKPCRLPNTFNSPRTASRSHASSTHSRSQHELTLMNRPPINDDRKCLPSYARDATSEVVSMYETASQKSAGKPRVSGDPDCRSYSMTQTSYTPYTLSNHRSYASLRSQPELNMVQRPRSPFPYPARLKRLGFRPSSPVLTNGEVDYSRPVDAERVPNIGVVEPMDQKFFDHSSRFRNCSGKYADGSVQENFLSKPSPSSVYVQRKAPLPLALNRLPSPQHGSSGSSRQQISERGVGTAATIYDWRNRAESLPRNDLPARNMSGLASAVNFYQSPLPVSAITAPRKLHGQAPLYYDYTEDFDIEEEYCNHADAENLSLQSPLIDGVINGHRNLGSEHAVVNSLATRPLDVSVNFKSQGHRSGWETDSRESAKITESMTRMMNQTSEADAILKSQPYGETLNNPTSERGVANETFAQGISRQSPPKHKLTNRRSTKSSIFGSEPSSGPRQASMLLEGQAKLGQEDTTGIDSVDSTIDRNSSYDLLNYLPGFPSPPAFTPKGNVTAMCDQHNLDIESEVRKPDWANYTETVTGNNRPLTLHLRRHSQALPFHDEMNADRAALRRSASARDESNRTSRFYSIDCGLADLAQLLSRFEIVNKSPLSEDPLPPASNISSRAFQVLPPRDKVVLKNKQDSRIISPLEPQFSFPINRLLTEDDTKGLKKKPSGRQDRILLKDPNGFNKRKVEGNGIPNLNHRIPRKPLSRSASPILAPEPISPARVLRLKNSVPQLMKALPPIPLECTACQESKPNLEPNTATMPIPVERNSTEICLTSAKNGSLQAIDMKSSARPSKFKLKPKLPFSHQQDLLLNARSWNPETCQSTNPQPDVRPAITMPKNYTSKFKLRGNKSSTPVEGTVRINKEARSHKAVNNLDLGYQKDLFATPGFSGMFQQVGRHFNSRKMSQSDEPPLSLNDAHPFNPAVVQRPQDSGLESLIDLCLPQSLTGTTCPTDVRSFFSDDSSQVQGHNSLRKRISNLRARIPVPYTSRSAAQTSNDVIWKERTGRSTPDVRRFKFSLTASQDSAMITEADVRPRRLRSKVSGWLKEARSAVTGCVRQRNNDELKLYYDN